jgi:hypothetical protein
MADISAWLNAPCNRWRRECFRRAAQGEDQEAVSEDVVIRYLSCGDARPFVDAVQSELELPLAAQKYLGAMLDVERAPRLANRPVNHQFSFFARQKPGRNSKPEITPALRALSDAAGMSLDSLESGALIPGSFWRRLAWCTVWGLLAQFERPRSKKPQTYAILVPLLPARGRPDDCELQERDRLLAGMVAERMQGRGAYDAAIKATSGEITHQARQEGWCGKISERTVKRAYDALARPK